MIAWQIKYYSIILKLSNIYDIINLKQNQYFSCDRIKFSGGQKQLQSRELI